jgi:GntR family transcriptional repressor for pyruvate dehydrogenase complex
MGSDVGHAVQLGPLRVPKAPDVLAEDLRGRIISGELAEGVALPPERELVSQTGMSRTTVREALRILEVQGLVRIRAGRSGGAFVQRPGAEALAATTDLVIRCRQTSLGELLETSAQTHPACAALAARHRTDEDLANLDLASESAGVEGPLTGFLTADVAWHIALAGASHNDVLSGCMLGVARAVYEATPDKGFLSRSVRQATVDSQRGVTRAVLERDAGGAADLMRRHVRAHATAVLTQERHSPDS